MGMIKYLLFIFNFIFAICGIGILTVGILARVQLSSVSGSLDTNVMFPSITLIVLGSIIFIISFFGCCGAIRESHCMTITFASFLLFILLVQVAVAVYAFVVVKNPENITEEYRKIFHNQTVEANKEFVNVVQSGFECCGIDNPTDYAGNIPWSCCRDKKEGETCSYNDSFKDGCSKKITQLLQAIGTTLGGIAIGIAGVELLGIIFALCLANSIRNTERRGYRV